MLSVLNLLSGLDSTLPSWRAPVERVDTGRCFSTIAAYPFWTMTASKRSICSWPKRKFLPTKLMIR